MIGKRKNTFYLYAIVWLMVSGPCAGMLFGQISMTGSLATHIDSLIDAMPASAVGDQDKYQAPSSPNLMTWGNTITQIMQGNYSAAQDSAGTIGYQIVRFSDNTTSSSHIYYVLEKTFIGTNYWGTFAYNPSPLRGKLFIQSPHPLYDSNTGQQGIAIFMNVGAKSFFVSGTHRCNSTINTTCSGTTDVCGGNYKISDQAHVVDGTLQKSTEILNAAIDQLIVIQAHGFGKDPADPYVIMGNGKATAPTGTDYLVRVRDNLLALDGVLTSKVAHIDVDWTTLIGTTNTQGRLINGSSNPCNSAPSTANGRFLHIEQALDRLRNNSINRQKLSDAIAMTFAVDGLTVTSPNGGENWSSASVQSITWTSSGFVDNVKLEYTLDNGKHWNAIISSATNSGSYLWTVPAAGVWNAKVRISNTVNSAVGDTSDGIFKITGTVWPTTGNSTYAPIASAFSPRILSGAYDFHRGIDCPGNLNTPIHPAMAGVVVRFEDTSVTQGTSRERYGNWILVRHDSVGDQPRHTAYLHLNTFNGYSVGDTVSTNDTIAWMGKSGVGINTIHLHFEYYKNLIGTSVDNDKAFNPLEILPYTDGNGYSVSFDHRNDSASVLVEVPETELDFDGIVVYGSLGSRTISFNNRTGIDPANNDNPRYNSIFIDPDKFTIDSTVQRLRFWTKDGELGTIDSARISDIKGYIRTVISSSGTRYAVVSGTWTSAIWASTSGGAAGSANTPQAGNNIVVNENITVTINTAAAECGSVSFGGTNGKFAFVSGSLLSVYGDFTIASPTHSAFSSWAEGAKLRFTGSGTQTISGYGDFNAVTTSSFKELQINKIGGQLRTPGASSGNGMCISVVDTLDIINGILYLNTRDDIQGRSLTGITASTPVIIIRSGGTLTMAGSASHIRSGNVSASSTPIGTLTVFGTATIATTSTNGVNFGKIDVEEGGSLILNSFSASAQNNFKPGMITVKSGSTVTNNSTINFWNASAAVSIQSGAVYYVKDTVTIMPPAITNNGLIDYAMGSGNQTIVDMNYSSLRISSSGASTWTLAAARTISDSLVIDIGSLQLASGSPRTLTVNNSIRLNGGQITTGTNTVSLGTSGSAVGTLTRMAGKFYGNLKRWIPAQTLSNILFPFNENLNDRSAVLSFTQAPLSAGTVTGGFTCGNPGNTGLPLLDGGTTVDHASPMGYWTMSAAEGLIGGTFSLDLTGEGIEGITNTATLRILKRSTGGAWTLEGSHAAGTGTVTLPVVHRTGISGFSEFGIGSGADNALPVEIVNFSASVNGLNVFLGWKTMSENSNYGFEIERTPVSENSYSWITVGFRQGAGTTAIPHRYEFIDALNSGGKYKYRLKQIDERGTFRYVSAIEVDADVMPRELRLYPNYPNPFNAETIIEFTVPNDADAVVRVFNIIGQQVAEVFHGPARAGSLHQARFDGSQFPSGIYFVRLESFGATTIRKIISLK
jgi:murein DD-endopeptidase MepM/ murein hydrolase activator NlpD